MTRYFRRLAVAALLLAGSSAANAVTIHVCHNSVYTTTTIETNHTAGGTFTTVVTTVVGVCTTEWSYVEAIRINTGSGVTFEETGPRGLGPVRALTNRSPVVVAIRSGWRRMSSPTRLRYETTTVSEDEARRMLAQYDGARELRIGLPLHSLPR